MTFDAEAIIPIEVGLSSIRMADFVRSSNDERMVRNLDAFEERRELVAIWLVDQQQKLAQGYNRKVRPQDFLVGDLVLQKTLGGMKDQNAGKFALNWEGPYQLTAMVGAGAYYLEDMEERPLL